jgi:hypothetical protein
MHVRRRISLSGARCASVSSENWQTVDNQKPAMVLFALSFLVPLFAAADDINASVDAKPANITQIRQTLLVDYTNTIVYSLTETEMTTVGLTAPYGDVEGLSKSVRTYTVRSVVAAFVQTIFRVKKLVDVTPAPSKWAGVPPPTQSLRFIIFKPYILCMGLFGILFLGEPSGHTDAAKRSRSWNPRRSPRTATSSMICPRRKPDRHQGDADEDADEESGAQERGGPEGERYSLASILNDAIFRRYVSCASNMDLSETGARSET